MSTHANMVKMTVTSVGADPYTITLNAASSGFQSFADAYGANATVDILITQGTVWEVARNCTYTHSGTTVTRGTFEDSSTGSRITTFDNTAVVSVVATADSGRRWDSAALTELAASPTSAGVTGVVGTMHLLDISGLTGARDFVLPTTAATGDRIGVFCTTDAPTTAAYVLQIKSGASGDLINGTDHSATIWSSLLIKGECLIFRCTDGTGPHWIVEYDGRIPQSGGYLITSASATGGAGGTIYLLTDFPSATATATAGAGMVASAGAVTTRRAGTFNVVCSYATAASCSSAKYVGAFIYVGGSIVARNQLAAGAAGNGYRFVGWSGQIAVDTTIDGRVRSEDASKGADDIETFWYAVEVL